VVFGHVAVYVENGTSKGLKAGGEGCDARIKGLRRSVGKMNTFGLSGKKKKSEGKKK